MDRRLEDELEAFEAASAFDGHAGRTHGSQEDDDDLLDGPDARESGFNIVMAGRYGRGDRPSYWEGLWAKG